MGAHNLPPDVAWMALDYASDIVICLDEKRNIIHINEAAQLHLGYEIEELISVPVHRISPDFPALPEPGGPGLDKPLAFRTKMVGKGGRTMVPFDVSLVSFAMDERTYYWAFARNITLRTMAEEALRQSELKFRGAFQDAAVGMAIFSPDGYFSEVNPYLCETLGYTEEEFKNFHFLDITYPDDIESSTLYDNMIRQKKIPSAYHEKRYIGKNGKPVWFIASDSLMRDETGETQYVLAHFQDITKRKEIEGAVKAAEKRFRLFMDNMPGMAFIKNREGRYLFGNRFMEKRIQASGLEGISGITDNEIFEPEYAKQIARNDNEVLVTGESVELIEERPGPSGTEEWLVSRFPINHDDGSTLLGGVAIDISAQVETQRSLEEKEKQLGAQAENLEQVNTALKVLLDHREQEKVKLEETMMASLEKLVLPYLQEALQTGSAKAKRTCIDIAISNIKDISAPFARRLSTSQARLSPAELRVADLLRHERTSDEIAELLAISPYTVARHRESIRRKLGLTNKKVNLKTYLQTIS